MYFMNTPISEQEYFALLKEIQPFFESNPLPGSPEAARFVELVELISSYDDKNFPEVKDPKAQAIIEFQIQGIRCDTEGCDFEDRSVLAENLVDWVDRPCPKCGANLITEDDWDMIDKMLAFTEITNRLIEQNALGFALPNENGEFDAIALGIDDGGIPTIYRKIN